ncbi:MAG: SUMF1/EgtB/PvdO family nonheme iron enzyme [Deltaproteobacteria bacterium]|nr:SUMF1/EgtB/PvdO family nonheme iron enzyme [Deltaproteobacteria bacterium]
MNRPSLVAALLALLLSSPALAAAPEDAISIPAGPAIVGRDGGPAEEAPAHPVRLRAYRIGRHEVSNADFLSHLREHGGFGTLEGQPYLGSLELALEGLAQLEREQGGPLSKVEASLEPQVRARWQATIAAVRAATGEDARAGIAGLSLEPHRERLRREAELPVRWLTWRDARVYCRAAGGDLPTEAQWERAARGKGGRAYPFEGAWEAGRCPIGLEAPAPVDAHSDCATPEGARGMAGNVWEWTLDWYDAGYFARSPAADPTGPEGLPEGRLPPPDPEAMLLRTPGQGRETDTRKVLKGGGYASPSDHRARFDARSTRRSPLAPGEAHPDVGLRCVWP